MDTIGFRVASASTIGAHHARLGRNGQDAAAAWTDCGAAVVVVCDGCSAGASSELGARLGAGLVVHALARRLANGAAVDDPALWAAMRADVVQAISELVARQPGDRTAAIAEHWLFTIVAAAASGDRGVLWILGDGAYAIDGAPVTVGPFADNQPPYLGYDLIGEPRPAQLVVAPAGWTSLAVATDGVLDAGLAPLIAPRFVAHPDALRRRLAVLARAEQRVDWAARRIVRMPAQLQDDGAVALLFREAA